MKNATLFGVGHDLSCPYDPATVDFFRAGAMFSIIPSVRSVSSVVKNQVM
jgi:hypothetical protein